MKPADALASRLRPLLPQAGIDERKMFGAVCFMLDGNMLVAAMKGGELLVRTAPDREEWALAQEGAGRMRMGSREMTGFIAIAPEAAGDDSIVRWVAFAEAFVRRLPPK
jgi:hypothetical protein